MGVQFLLLIPLAGALYWFWVFNRFVGLEQRAENAFSDVDVLLKRRWDLITSLVEVVKGYSGYEKEVLEKVTSARNLAEKSSGDSLGRREKVETNLASALRGIFVVVEGYPELKADRNFLKLHESLVKVEDDIQYSRRYFNAVVRDYNTLFQRFPSSVVAGASRFELLEFFQVEQSERSVPPVHLRSADSSEAEKLS